MRAKGTGGRSARESPAGEAGWGWESRSHREWNKTRGGSDPWYELRSGATGSGGVPRVRNPAKRLRRALALGEGRRPAGRSRGEGVCAAEATALSLPGRKEAGKGAAAVAAAAAAAVEYSVPRGGGKGRNGGARGREAVRAHGERGLSCGIDVRSLGFPQRREHG